MKNNKEIREKPESPVLAGWAGRIITSIINFDGFILKNRQKFFRDQGRIDPDPRFREKL